MKIAIRKNIHNMSQGPPNPGFIKSTKKGFSKKALIGIEIFVLF